jgi:hypothetical protein
MIFEKTLLVKNFCTDVSIIKNMDHISSPAAVAAVIYPNMISFSGEKSKKDPKKTAMPIRPN